MGKFVDLLIQGNDLVLDPAQVPALVQDRASIAQDLGHMIRESGLLVGLVAERSSLRRRDCLQQIELLMEADGRLVPGTAHIATRSPGRYLVTAETVDFGKVEVWL